MMLLFNVTLLLVNVIVFLNRGSHTSILENEAKHRREEMKRSGVTPIRIPEVEGGKEGSSDDFLKTLMAEKNRLQRQVSIHEAQQKELKSKADRAVEAEKLCRNLLEDARKKEP